MKPIGSGTYQPDKSPILILQHVHGSVSQERLRNNIKFARGPQAVQDLHSPTVHMKVS